MKFALTKTQAQIVKAIQENGKKIYCVGGAVRDVLLGNEPKDIDFATNYDHNALRVLASKMGLTCIPDATAMQHGIVRIVDVDTGGIIDIARFRKDDTTDGRHAKVSFTDNIYEDLRRRDFTINGMAVEVGTNEVIDPFNGQDHLKEKRIIFIGNLHDRIREDYLRLMRMCRFTALGSGWQIGAPISAIRDHVKGIHSISKERIRDEIIKALKYNKPSNFFRALEETHLLPEVFPELQAGVGCKQNKHHAEPVFDHLLRCLDASVPLTNDPMLRLSALTHDIAKPHTKSIGPDGEVHFYMHEVVGADLMYKWMMNLKFPKKDAEYVSKMVRHHQWRFAEDTKDKTIRRWLVNVGPQWRDLITLRMADRLGNLKKAHKPPITREMKSLIERAEKILADEQSVLNKTQLAINGHDLIEMGMKPSKAFREIFDKLLNIVIDEPERNTKEWLIQYVKLNYT